MQRVDTKKQAMCLPDIILDLGGTMHIVLTVGLLHKILYSVLLMYPFFFFTNIQIMAVNTSLKGLRTVSHVTHAKYTSNMSVGSQSGHII